MMQKRSNKQSYGTKVQDMKSLRLPARASIYYLAASFIGKAVGFFIIPLSTRLLSSEDYGMFSLYMALLGGATLICSSFSSGSAVYKGLKEYSENQPGLLRGVLYTSLSFSAILCILLFAFHRLLGLNSLLIIPLSLQIICDVITAVAISGLRFNYLYKRVFIIMLASSLIPPLLSIIILRSVGGGYLVRIYSLLGVSIILAIYSLYVLYAGGSENRRVGANEIVVHSLPLLPHSISSALAVQADKLIITGILGASALAKYTVVYSLGMALQFTITAIGAALAPWIIRKLDAGENERIQGLISPMLLGYCALSLCLVSLGPEAMMILAPQSYLDALPALIPLATSTPFSFISSVASVAMVHYGRGRDSIIVAFVGGALSVGLNFVLIGKLGFLGAGISALVSQISTAFLSLILLRRSVGLELISVQKVALPCFISIVIGFFLFSIRNFLGLRIFMLIIPGAILLYCMTKARSLIFELKA